MKTKNSLFIRNLLCKIMLTLALVVGWNDAWGDDDPLTLTVYDNTTTGKIPFDAGLYSMTGPKGQFIIPASLLEDMNGKTITHISFYGTSTSDRSFGEFSIYLTETEKVRFTSTKYESWGNMTSYYSGALTFSSSTKTMDIDLSYPYSGGNLLIGFSQTSTGSYAFHNWYGETQTGDNYTALYTSNADGTITGVKFLPKITFTYETPAVATLSITPNEDAAFGSKYESADKVYRVTNNSGSTVNVVPSITGTDYASFSVSPSSADIAKDGYQDFTLSFNYSPSSLGDKTASITFTPDEDGSNAISKDITVTAVSNFTISSTDGVFGNVTADANKVYTITNHTGSAVNVTPNVTGSDMFSVSPSEKTAIANGGSQDFTVTFDWQADVTKFGEKTATITLKPDNGYSAFNISASATATADAVLDESNATTWTSGSGKSVLVKYQPVAGWNTICVPFTTSTYITGIFGDNASNGTKYYTLTNYSNGVLTITKQTGYVAANTPCFVYVETAKDNSVGALLTGVYVYQASNATPGKVDLTVNEVKTTILQGTYTGLSMYNKYGLTPSGKIMKGGSSSNLKGFRAYFTNVAPPKGSDAHIGFIIEEKEEGTTDLGLVKMFDENAKNVYTLSGQKVKKAGKGIYIVNGKKVVIK